MDVVAPRVSNVPPNIDYIMNLWLAQKTLRMASNLLS
jgi:hypothetical protein